jgi:5-methylcytosine-specific restriction endonuclease McrA
MTTGRFALSAVSAKAKENRRLCAATYRATHREHTRNYHAKWYVAHREQQRVSHATWLTEHREQKQTSNAKWQKEHPEQVRAYTSNHIHRKRANGGNFSHSSWEYLKTLFGHRCVYCKRRMKRLTQDHIIPVSKGGWHVSMNIVPACQSCNSRKGNQIYAS